MSLATRAPSSVADMASRRRSSRKPPCASSARARPRSASSERSWNSSKRTAATPSSAGSSRIMRENTPSVTTSMRVRRPILDPRRTRSPTVSPTSSPSVRAMRSAAARAASRRGSSTISLRCPTQGSSRSVSGTRVDLPAPGGATSTAFGRARKEAASCGKTSSIGSGVSKARMRPRWGEPRRARKRLRLLDLSLSLWPLGAQREERMRAGDYEILDDRFRHLVKVAAKVEKLYEGCRWAEGPAYFPAHRYVVWSDIPNDRMLRFDETTGQTGIFRHPAGYSNGNSVDREGRLVTCEHGHRRVTRTEHDGSVTVVADEYGGKRLNSPNDVVVKSDGSVWFTDPPFGLYAFYEGTKTEPEHPHTNVYRVDGATGEIALVADDIDHPNGLAFSLDESVLYIIESRSEPRNILAYDVAPDGRNL